MSDERLKKLRLVMFEECNRACKGCCNNDWDLNALDIATSYKGYDTVMLTGGEPMLRPLEIIDVAGKIREQTGAKIFLYTAKTRRAFDLIAILHCIDGVTVTLHEPYDVGPFEELNSLLMKLNIDRSYHLNVFKGVDLSHVDTRLWKVKKGIEWIKDCPLPEGEVMQRM